VEKTSMLILVLLLLQLTTIVVDADYTGKTLSQYKGVEFEIYHVRRLQVPESKGIIRYNEIADFLSNALYLITNNPADILSKLRYSGYTTLKSEKIYVYVGSYNGSEIIVAVGDMGHFYIKVGDGKASVYQSCNLSFRNYLENIRSVIRGRLPDNEVKIMWKGQYGEKTAYMMTGQVCYIVNSTTICTQPKSPSIEKTLYNLYEVYYIYLGSYRIEPPIRVRCCDPRYQGVSAVYVEGFIPTLSRNVSKVILDDTYIDKIVSLIRETGINANKDNLLVEDIYLTLDPGNGLLIPVLVLKYENMKFWIGLEEDKPLLLSYGSYTGSGDSPREGDNGLRLNWNNIISSAMRTKTSSEDYNIIIYTIIFIAVIPIAFYYWKRHKK
jgi:hypothetical protein